MTTIVFTGPAADERGNPVLRADLIDMVQQMGFTVQKSVGAKTKLLVASRSDTVKAKRAAERGIPVITYPEFFAKLGQIPEPSGRVNSWTDELPKKPSAQAVWLDFPTVVA